MLAAVGKAGSFRRAHCTHPSRSIPAMQNHGWFYAVQLAAIMRCAGDDYRAIRAKLKALLPKLLQKAGKTGPLLLELKRTRALHYHFFALSAMILAWRATVAVELAPTDTAIAKAIIRTVRFTMMAVSNMHPTWLRTRHIAANDLGMPRTNVSRSATLRDVDAMTFDDIDARFTIPCQWWIEALRYYTRNAAMQAELERIPAACTDNLGKFLLPPVEGDPTTSIYSFGPLLFPTVV